MNFDDDADTVRRRNEHFLRIRNLSEVPVFEHMIRSYPTDVPRMTYDASMNEEGRVTVIAPPNSSLVVDMEGA